jgi:predicted transcriptional regulator
VADTSVAYVLDETVMTRREAAERLRVSPAAVTNYFVRGLHGVYLEGVLVGGTRRTSAEAVDRFVEARTAAVVGELPAPVARKTARQWRREHEEAEARLRARGLL